MPPASTTTTTPLSKTLYTPPPTDMRHSPYISLPRICHLLGCQQHSHYGSSACDFLHNRQIRLRKCHPPVQQQHHHTLPYRPIPPATMANQKFNQKLQ